MKSFKQFLSEDSAVLYHGSANIKRNGWTGELRLDVAPNGYSRKVGDLVDSLGTILDARTVSQDGGDYWLSFKQCRRLKHQTD